MLSLPAARKRHRYRGGRQSRDATGGSLARLHWLPHQDGCARPGCRCGCAHWTSSLSARSHSLTQRRFEENEERLEERDGACLGCRHAEAYGHREQGVGGARQRPRGRRQHRLARGGWAAAAAGHSAVSDPLRPQHCRLPDCSVRGVSRAWMLEWAAILFSNQGVEPEPPALAPLSQLGGPIWH